MKISFLVLVACLCFTAVSAKKREVKVEESSFKNADGLDVQGRKEIARTEHTDVQTYQEGDAVIEEETTRIRTSIEGKRRGKKKVEKWVEAAQVPCLELPNIKEEVANCKGDFEVLNEATCEWRCKIEEKIVEIIEVPVEVESEVEGIVGEKRKRKVKKEGGAAVKRRISGGAGGDDGKECSGFKKINFSNCLLKIRGFIGFGKNKIKKK